MCGRFTLALTSKELRDYFKAQNAVDIDPRYNIAPTQNIPVIISNAESGARTLMLMRWGLVPHWAKDLSIGSRLINARAEMVEVKPAFRSAFKHHRCLIPSTGFYEWDKSRKVHQPYFIGLSDQTPFAFAGLWEEWRDTE